VVALPHPTTAGIPSSLATMAAWDKGAPMSVMMAAALGKRGVHPTLVVDATNISPVLRSSPSYGLVKTRTTPSILPAAPA